MKAVFRAFILKRRVRGVEGGVRGGSKQSPRSITNNYRNSDAAIS